MEWVIQALCLELSIFEIAKSAELQFVKQIWRYIKRCGTPNLVAQELQSFPLLLGWNWPIWNTTARISDVIAIVVNPTNVFHRNEGRIEIRLPYVTDRPSKDFEAIAFSKER